VTLAKSGLVWFSKNFNIFGDIKSLEARIAIPLFPRELVSLAMAGTACFDLLGFSPTRSGKTAIINRSIFVPWGKIKKLQHKYHVS
jgi:hypothetical protein